MFPAQRSTFARLAAPAAVICTLTLLAGTVAADVVVLANRTGSRVTFQVQPRFGPAQQMSLPAGEVMPFFSDGRVGIELATGGQTRSYLLGANSMYYFVPTDGRGVRLQKVGLGGDNAAGTGRPLPGRASAPSATIPVKILVDEEEPGRQFLWERRLRGRIEAVSAVLDKYCRVRLKVVAVGTWNSDNAITDFEASLNELEREAKPFPARLAIGFTSQYQFQRGRIHLAGTHGPLRSHILVREAARSISEPARVELLVHELGHYLGASHSPEPSSVMRPVLGGSTIHLRFDPVNTLAIALVGEELRRRRVDSLADLTGGTKMRLRQIYGELSRAFPRDPAAKQLLMTTRAASQP